APYGRRGGDRRGDPSPRRWSRRTWPCRAPGPSSPPLRADKAWRGQRLGGWRWCVFRVWPWRLLRDLDAHGAGRTFHHAHRRLDRIAVEILHLLLGDLAHLRLGHGAGLVATRRLRSALELCRLLDEIGDRRRAHLERERAVLIDRDHDRDRRSLLHLLGLRIELLADLHEGEAALPERGPDGGRRIGRPRRHLQFDVSGDFLCHDDLTPVVGR